MMPRTRLGSGWIANILARETISSRLMQKINLAQP